VITLTTDFGLSDHYVGVMKGVILTVYPAAKVVDISHGVEPFSVAQGAFYLAQSYSRFPAGTVHVGVVDPGVGGPRRALAACAGGQYFVVPDNGLLSQVFDAEREAAVIAIDTERYGLERPSRTFHGRDVFAPAAAWLARGTAFESMGARVDDFVRLGAAGPRVLNIDRFGNIVSSLLPADLPAGAALKVGRLSVRARAETYLDAPEGEPALIVGSSGRLEVSIREGSAAEAAGARIGDRCDVVE
jgi:hypothetical protein